MLERCPLFASGSRVRNRVAHLKLGSRKHRVGLVQRRSEWSFISSELLTWYARKVSAFCFRIAGSQPRSAFEAGFPETSCWSGSAQIGMVFYKFRTPDMVC